MKFSAAALCLLTMSAPVADGQMVKMCLFYGSPSGHVRSDPIIDNQCASGHVHTFYGPTNIHPNTDFDDLINTSPSATTSPYLENQSLYWHPSIYRVVESNGVKTYFRESTLDTSPYYRWDKQHETLPFPDKFRMIAHSNDLNADAGGETDGNLLVECCNLIPGEDPEEFEEDCTFSGGPFIEFPTQACDFVGIGFAMPTCWDGVSNGDDNDHKDHMRYTTDGNVAGPCPTSHPKRLPQVQLFVRINNYQGGTYVLSDESNVFHVDFFNGWKDNKLKQIIDSCPVVGNPGQDGYNPPCNCDQFLTENEQAATAPLCDVDVREMIIDEETDVVVGDLPKGSCKGPTLKPRSWTGDFPADCVASPTTPVPMGPPVTPSPVTTPSPVAPVTPSPVTTPAPQILVSPTPAPEDNIFETCEDECWDAFHECEDVVEDVCAEDMGVLECFEVDCYEELEDEDEIHECELLCEEECWSKQEKRCRRRRKRCIRNCE